MLPQHVWQTAYNLIFYTWQITVQIFFHTAVNIKSRAFWDVTPCSLVNRYQRFAGTCSRHFLQWEAAGFSNTLVPAGTYATNCGITSQKTVTFFGARKEMLCHPCIRYVHIFVSLISLTFLILFLRSLHPHCLGFIFIQHIMVDYGFALVFRAKSKLPERFRHYYEETQFLCMHLWRKWNFVAFNNK
jgi:hypothetical protein